MADGVQLIESNSKMTFCPRPLDRDTYGAKNTDNIGLRCFRTVLFEGYQTPEPNSHWIRFNFISFNTCLQIFLFFATANRGFALAKTDGTPNGNVNSHAVWRGPLSTRKIQTSRCSFSSTCVSEPGLNAVGIRL